MPPRAPGTDAIAQGLGDLSAAGWHWRLASAQRKHGQNARATSRLTNEYVMCSAHLTNEEKRLVRRESLLDLLTTEVPKMLVGSAILWANMWFAPFIRHWGYLLFWAAITCPYFASHNFFTPAVRIPGFGVHRGDIFTPIKGSVLVLLQIAIVVLAGYCFGVWPFRL